VRIIRSPRTVTVVALVAAIAVLGAVPSLAVPGETFRASFGPSSVFVGSTGSFTATVTNQGPSQQIGSAEITPPPGFTVGTITSFSLPSPATATVSGGRVRLRTLGLGVGASASVTFDARVACTATAGTWTVVARKSPNFTSSSGDPTLDAPNSQLSVDVTGQCHLAFATPPTDAQVDTSITGQAFSPSGPPVTVNVLDGGDAVITGSAAPVTLGVTPAPGGGVSGNGPVNASAGVAAFSAFQIHTSGLGFGVVASTTEPGIAASAPVTIGIWDFGVACPSSGDCVSPPIVEGTTTGQLTVGEGASTASMSLGVEGLDCPGYTEVSAVITFASTGGGLKTVTITIPRSLGGDIRTRQVCYSSPDGFVDKFGIARGPDEPGLLAPCVGPEQAPCVVSKTAISTTKVIVFRAPGGDPRGRT
jgi:hypothetical protein